MNRIDELMTDFCSVYGDEWTRANLSDEEHIAWVDALYEYYESECSPAPFTGLPAGGYAGRDDYYITSRVKSGLGWSYTLDELPLWVIGFSPEEQFIVTPGEIFDIPYDLPETMLPSRCFE